jgi:haloalkane dehalogenase
MVSVETRSLESSFIEIEDSQLHYIDVGEGDVVLFLHGVPTSSYLWRNIIPEMSRCSRCIAVDLIGMGLSGKPNIDYTIHDHIRYIDAFIKKLNLTNITLVMHGWGSVVGFDYASRHPDNVKALAFFESHIRPATDWDQLSLPVQQFASKLSRPEVSYRAVVEQNYLIKRVLPGGVVNRLSDEVLEHYERPFKTRDSRKVLWQYVQDLPLGQASESSALGLINRYSDWLTKVNVPKLMLYAVPGFITTLDTVTWAKQHLTALTLESLDDVMHFAQESEPTLFTEKLKIWYKTQVLMK